VLSELVMHDARAGLICFTHGEASTLHGRPGRLFTLRAHEVQAAGAELRLSRVELHRYPDGQLDTVPSTS
jgi:N-acetylglucosamine malate deacetylase 2